MKIGYARVSTDEQNLDLQLHALAAAGCEEVFQDQGVSGVASAPPRPAGGSGKGRGRRYADSVADRPARAVNAPSAANPRSAEKPEYRLSVDHGRNRHEPGGGPPGVLDGRRYSGIRAQ